MKHKLIDIIAIVIFAGVCGIGELEDLGGLAELREYWLRKNLKLPNEIPSHDTISRVFSSLKSDENNINVMAKYIPM